MNNFIVCMLMVTADCQRNCPGCVTDQARKKFSEYDLSLDDLENFIKVSEDSNYRYDQLTLNGFGEPLLWSNLEEGVKMLARSKSIGDIMIRSNGMNTDAVTESLLDNIKELSVTKYKGTEKKLQVLQSKFGNRVLILPDATFIRLKGMEAPIPCNCRCSGPTIIGKWALPHCGPVLFGTETVERLINAGKITKEKTDNLTLDNFVEYLLEIDKSISPVKVEKDFLHSIINIQTWDKFSKRNMDACRFCWGNDGFTHSLKNV
jgi:hypothetical protein